MKKNVDKFTYSNVTGYLVGEFDGEEMERIQLDTYMSREEVEEAAKKHGWILGGDYIKKSTSQIWWLD